MTVDKNKVGLVGIGDMGSGLAKNLLKAGFDVCGFDLDLDRMNAFTEMGGIAAPDLGEVAANARAVFVMVMTGHQAKQVIFSKNGLADHLPSGSVIILTATIKPAEAAEISASAIAPGATK